MFPAARAVVLSRYCPLSVFQVRVVLFERSFGCLVYYCLYLCLERLDMTACLLYNLRASKWLDQLRMQTLQEKLKAIHRLCSSSSDSSSHTVRGRVSASVISTPFFSNRGQEHKRQTCMLVSTEQLILSCLYKHLASVPSHVLRPSHALTTVSVATKMHNTFKKMVVSAKRTS